MSTIYIVAGSTGEYSDRTDWNVCAFISERAAQERIRKLDDLMQQCGVTLDVKGFVTVGDWGIRRDAAVEAMKSHPDGDPDFRCYYNSTSYSYSACELVKS